MAEVSSHWHTVKESDSERIRCQEVIYAGDTCGKPAVACEHTEGGSFFYYCEEHATARGSTPFSCPKCGRLHRSTEFEDEGTGAEAGRTFRYCSAHCRRTH
jgi:hypothetical protein